MNEIVNRFGKITKVRAIGIDEISVRKGHTYMTCVSDLDKGRPLWIGGEGRREEDLDLFYGSSGKSVGKILHFYISGNIQVSIFNRRYSSSLKP